MAINHENSNKCPWQIGDLVLFHTGRGKPDVTFIPIKLISKTCHFESPYEIWQVLYLDLFEKVDHDKFGWIPAHNSDILILLRPLNES